METLSKINDSFATHAFTNASRKAITLDVVHIGVSVTILLVILCANVSVLLATCSSKKSSCMKQYIMNLAFADLSVGLFAALPSVIDYLVHYEFYGSNALCKGYKFAGSVSSMASAYALVALSIDRLDAIRRPFRFTSNNNFQTRLLITSAWTLSFIFCSPKLLLFTKANYPQSSAKYLCIIQFPGNQTLTSKSTLYLYYQLSLTMDTLAVFFIPLFIISISHIYMVILIFRAGKRAPKSTTSRHPNLSTERLSNTYGFANKSSACDLIDEMSLIRRRRPIKGNRSASNVDATPRVKKGCIPRAKVKTVKLTCVIVAVYVVCWCPYMLWNLLVTFQVVAVHTSAGLWKLSLFMNLLYSLNSAANPLIFWIFTGKQNCTAQRCCLSTKKSSNQHQLQSKTSPGWYNTMMLRNHKQEVIVKSDAEFKNCKTEVYWKKNSSLQNDAINISQQEEVEVNISFPLQSTSKQSDVTPNRLLKINKSRVYRPKINLCTVIINQASEL